MCANHDQTTVAALIAVYNGAEILTRAVNSCQAQSRQLDEIIIVDDASSDGSATRAIELAKADPRIRVIQREVNGGPAAARNEGLRAATARWVVVLDADDAMMPDRVRNLLVHAERHHSTIVVDNFVYVDPRTEVVADLGTGNLYAEAHSVSLVEFIKNANPFGRDGASWGLLKPMFDRVALERLDVWYPESSRHGEDLLFVIQAMIAGASYLVTPEIGYRYSTRSSGFSQTQVDFDAMADAVARLAEQPLARADPKLIDAIEDLSKSIGQLSAESKLSAAIRLRDWRKVAQLLATHPRCARLITRAVERRIASRRRRAKLARTGQSIGS